MILVYIQLPNRPKTRTETGSVLDGATRADAILVARVPNERVLDASLIVHSALRQ